MTLFYILSLLIILLAFDESESRNKVVVNADCEMSQLKPVKDEAHIFGVC